MIYLIGFATSAIKSQAKKPSANGGGSPDDSNRDLRSNYLVRIIFDSEN